MAEVPRVMVVQILSKLPPKSLMRFKCIHKLWNSLINSCHFVAKHFQFQKNQSSSTTILLKRPVNRSTETVNQEMVISLLTLRIEDDGDEDNLHYDIEDIKFSPSIGLTSRGQFIDTHGQSYDCAKIMGICDGIFCLSLYTARDLVLYNPSIKEFNLIPESFFRDKNSGPTGFGYDPKTEDYILVTVERFGVQKYGDRLVIEPLRAEMFTLGGDSWREIKIHNLETETTMFWPYHFQMYHMGKCYGLAHEIRKEFISSYDILEEHYIREVIVWFDTSDRVFHNTLVPDCLYEFPMHDFSLTVWNNSVALFGYYRGGSLPFEIWVMVDFDGVHSSWIKHLTIEVGGSRSLGRKAFIPLALWESNEILLVSTGTGIAAYNLVTERYKYLPLYGTWYIEAFPYVTSIVPVKRGNKFENEDL